MLLLTGLIRLGDFTKKQMEKPYMEKPPGRTPEALIRLFAVVDL